MTTGRHDPPPRAALYQLDDDALMGLIAFVGVLGVGVALFVRAHPVRAAIVLAGIAGGRAVTMGVRAGWARWPDPFIADEHPRTRRITGVLRLRVPPARVR